MKTNFLLMNPCSHCVVVVFSEGTVYQKGAENGIIISFKRSFFPEQISFIFITPPEGPLWKQGHIDLFNAIPAIFNLGCL